MPLIEIRDLTKTYTGGDSLFAGAKREVRAVDGVSLDISAGETLGLVGESGSGKSTLGRMVLRLIEPTSGTVRFDGHDLLTASSSRLRQLRRDMQIIFQDPFGSLDPRFRVEDIIAEPLVIHESLSKAARRARAGELLRAVGLDASALPRYPHEFSGGQRQRIGIARALAVGPEFIVADEPVSALDVSVQAQVLNLLVELQEQLDLTYLFISHNLGVVRHLSRRVVVMYLGRVVEEAPTGELFAEPLHPYTQALMQAVPHLDPDEAAQSAAVEGDLPNAIHRPSGCHFHPRCPFAMDVCRSESPELRRVATRRVVACHLYDDRPEVPAAGAAAQ